MASKEIELQYSSPENAPVSKKGYFISPIDKGWAKSRAKTVRRLGNTMETGSIITSFVTLIGGPIFLTISSSMGMSFWEAASYLVGSGLAGVASFILPFKSKHKRNKKAIEYAITVNARLIQDWLLKKYNLTVDNIQPISAHTMGVSYGTTGQSFSDSKGDQYKLDSINVNGTEEFFVVFVESAKSDSNAFKPKLDVLTIDADTKADVSKEEIKFAFNGEAEILHASIVARIQKLSTMDVDADKQYTLNFVAEELADVIEIQKKASSLDSTESIQPHIVAVLSDLNDELDKLIISELAEFERQLSVKRNHLAERKMGINSSIKAIESLSEKDSTHV